MERTYLHTCFRNDLTVRWPDGAMPIHVYIAPFTWYEKSKQQQALMYRQMVLDSLDAWRRATNNLVKFLVVDNLNQSQIDFKWRRVDRKSLGHCSYEMDGHNRMFSCEIQIGITDGLLYAEYQDTDEVQHTILHEIGHALGLIGHSDGPQDIMYVPHQYGVHTLSPRDVETINWLYSLPVGFNYKAVGAKYKLPPGFTINDVINSIEKRLKGEPEDPAQAKPASPPEPARSTASPGQPPRGPAVRRASNLDEQHEILSEMGRFYLKTQSIQVNKQHHEKLSQLMMEKKIQERRNRPPIP